MGNLPKTLLWILFFFLVLQPKNHHLYSCAKKRLRWHWHITFVHQKSVNLGMISARLTSDRHSFKKRPVCLRIAYGIENLWHARISSWLADQLEEYFSTGLACGYYHKWKLSPCIFTVVKLSQMNKRLSKAIGLNSRPRQQRAGRSFNYRASRRQELGFKSESWVGQLWRRLKSIAWVLDIYYWSRARTSELKR